MGACLDHRRVCGGLSGRLFRWVVCRNPEGLFNSEPSRLAQCTCGGPLAWALACLLLPTSLFNTWLIASHGCSWPRLAQQNPSPAWFPGTAGGGGSGQGSTGCPARDTFLRDASLGITPSSSPPHVSFKVNNFLRQWEGDSVFHRANRSRTAIVLRAEFVPLEVAPSRPCLSSTLSLAISRGLQTVPPGDCCFLIMSRFPRSRSFNCSEAL